MSLELHLEWTMRAACRGVPTKEAEKAFGSGPEQLEFVGRYCARCHVKPECWQAGRDAHGVAGGQTQVQRSKFLGGKRAARARAS